MGRKTGPQRRRLLAGTVSAAAHLMVLGALFWPRAAPHPPQTKPPPSLILVSLPPSPPGTAAAGPGVPTIMPPPLPQVTAPLLTIAATPGISDLLSDSQLAGATHAGEGPNGGEGGGGCDTAQAVQQSLRRDPLVRVAVQEAHRLGAAILLWNGDWVQSGGQDGKGLSAVREAVMWEVAFAPAACRNARMHGLVVLTLADGSTRFAIGSGEWRWSDLLGVRERR
jgi:hypothetical protein